MKPIYNRAPVERFFLGRYPETGWRMMSTVILTWNNINDIRVVDDGDGSGTAKTFASTDEAFAWAEDNDREIESIMRIVDLDA